jgi:hypothetical protein
MGLLGTGRQSGVILPPNGVARGLSRNRGLLSTSILVEHRLDALRVSGHRQQPGQPVSYASTYSVL